jgi:hypothetical protein
MDNHLFQNDMGSFGLVSPVWVRRERQKQKQQKKQIPRGDDKKKAKAGPPPLAKDDN